MRRVLGVVGATAIAVLLIVRVGSLTGLSEFRFPIAVGKALGVGGILSFMPFIPRRARPVAWFWVAGGSLNILAMALTGWLMPVWRPAILRAGMPDLVGQVPGYAYAETWLQVFLGDSVPVRWAGTVVSAGDLVLLLGAVWAAGLVVARQSHPS